ncbi:probable G-protein coupled receptor 139 [Carcharodon carcharias]|uniref:probable G-protein coupled receptor 139 n=1 Tax=Carcharodon carcharias TaxID=13397 RepID=UPI001B7EC1D9|nr:probable G-protein coupled receptor 139 [Carcharodon carcharias]
MERPIILRIKDIYYPVLVAIGTPVNLLTIVTLCRGNCHLSISISIHMVAMAVVDLLATLVYRIAHQILRERFSYSFLSCTVIFKLMLYMTCTNVGLSMSFTVCFTFDRFVAICCEKLKTRYCTERTAFIVIIIVSVLMCLENIPFWFAFEHKKVINNIQWGFSPNVAFFRSPVGGAYFRLQSVLVSLVPFAFILLCNCLTVRRIVVTNTARKTLRTPRTGNQRDPELENRRKSIILLLAMSANFILLSLTSVVSQWTDALVLRIQPEYADAAFIANESGYMLTQLKSCINTCIYAASQRKFREELINVVKSQWKFILSLVKI